jgi:phosphonate transport system substrate-binding protein
MRTLPRGPAFALAAVLLLAACADPEVGTRIRPFTMYFVPSVDAEQIALSSDQLTDWVARHVSQELYGEDFGFHVRSAIPTSYVAVVEAFGTNKADFAALNTFSYILAKDIKGYDVEAALAVVRGEGETSYKAQFVARVDSGIETLEDLAGKRFAYTDPASTAGFILPARLLQQRGIQPSDVVFAQKHDNVITMVYQGQVDAGATYYSPPRVVRDEDGTERTIIRDARARVLTQFPDVEEKIRIIGFSDDIPNEPWVVRGSLDPDPERNTRIKESVAAALVAYSKTEEGRRTLEELYNVSGLSRVDDARYLTIRRMILDSDLDLDRMLSGR